MNKAIANIIKGAFIMFTSIVEKRGQGLLTTDESRELLENLIQKTTSEIHRHRVSSFVTDN